MFRMRTRVRLAGLLLVLAAPALRGQTPSPTPTTSVTPSPTPTPTPTTSVTPSPTPTSAPNTFPAGQSWTTDSATAINGVRIRQAPDGSVFFLTPSNDRIVRLKDGAMTQWQLRDNADIGANPVDFQLDGDQIWFIDNGQSLIDAGKSIVAKLDTTTGALREWVMPISRPAGFSRTPDGKIWVAQTAGVLESLNLDTLEVVDYRAVPTVTFASEMTIGPDGALWMTDFGNNRIVRHDLTDSSQKAWLLFDPAAFRLNLSDLRFDEDGFLWLTEISSSRVDRFNPATGELRIYPGFTNPVHLDTFGGSVYVSEQTGANGRIAIIDPRVASFALQQLIPQALTVVCSKESEPCFSASLPKPKPATIRDSVITPIAFTPENAAFAASDLTVTASSGVLHVEFNKTASYGLTAVGGAVWVGSNGFLVRLVPQTIGGATDQTVPVALQFGTAAPDPVRVNLTLFNRGSTTLTGNALFQFSPGAFPQEKPFTVGPGATVFLEDAFAGAPSGLGLVSGSVRFQVTSGAGRRPLGLGAIGALPRQLRFLRSGAAGPDRRRDAAVGHGAHALHRRPHGGSLDLRLLLAHGRGGHAGAAGPRRNRAGNRRRSRSRATSRSSRTPRRPSSESRPSRETSSASR